MSNEIDLRKQRKVDADVTMETVGLAIKEYQLLAPNASVISVARVDAFEIFLRGANSLRKELTIYNNSNGKLYILFGFGTTSTNYSHKLSIGDSVHINDYRGVVNGLFAGTSGFAQITEVYY